VRIIRAEHAAVEAVLRSLRSMLDSGPGDDPERYFDVLRAMLFYIDEFPERLHHPKELDLLFPRVARRVPQLLPVIQRLEEDHLRGEGTVRSLQHLLLAWELLGEARRGRFEQAARRYIDFYREHMRMEEEQVLPLAEQVLDEADWAVLDAAFEAHRDPMVAHTEGRTDAAYDRLFTRIVRQVRSPARSAPG